MVAFGMVQLFFFGVSLAVDWRFFTLTASIYYIWIDSASITINYYTVHIHMYKIIGKYSRFSDIVWNFVSIIYLLTVGHIIVLRNFL